MTDLDDPQSWLGWQTFPEGRVRFNGAVRGGDEGGHDTIAVEIDGHVSYGEIELDPTADRTRYGLIVSSMGWKTECIVGAPLDAGGMRSFSPSQAERIRRLIAQLVADFVHREERPAFFFRPETAFTGSLGFADGWCFIADDAGPA